MFRKFAQRLTPPYSGQVQIVETDAYRALTLDGKTWEVQHLNRIHIRICTITTSDLKARLRNTGNNINNIDDASDPKLEALFDFLAEVEVPFPSTDYYEYWLLDKLDNTPLALLYTCTSVELMEKFPTHAEWASLPDAIMKVQKSDDELAAKVPPINYQLESLVSERAGTNKKARWYDRREPHSEFFPPFVVREDWLDPDHEALCKRYIDRQAPRLLMLQGLSESNRARLEASCEPYAMEVARFHKVYPVIQDEARINALLVEARLREASTVGGKSTPFNQRDASGLPEPSQREF